MANKVVIKRTSVSGREPTASDIDVGELAVNLADKKLFTKDGAGTVIQLGGGSGSGDVVGPEGATDNAIARFDTTTGKLIQDSSVTVSDNGDLENVNAVGFDITPATLPTAQGTLFWDNADSIQTLSLVMEGGNAVQQIGQEAYFRIKCSADITEGQVVMFSGTVGASGGLNGAPAQGLTASTASYVMGIATESGATNDWIYVTSFGLVRNINTTGGAESWVDGQILYYDPSVAGGLTKTLPSAPNAKVQVCAVIHAASNGSLFVRPSFGGSLGQYEGDTEITTPANGDLLIRNQTDGKWINAPLTGGTSISISNSAGGVTINNDAPDQTVSLSGGGTTTVGGTYPNFTISSSDQFTGTVTSVAATVPTGLTITGSPIISSGTLAISYTAGYAIPTTAKQTEWDTAFTDRNKWDGGATGLVASTGRTSLGGTTLGSNIFTITNPSAITFPRFNADNTVSALNSTDFRTAIGAGTGNGTVTSVGGTAPIASSGGATPTISITQSNSTTNGFLSSTDWNTFNNKQATLVSGTNIKTINGESVLGSGNLTVSAAIVYQ
jgi:hypothetical protein